MRHIYYLIILVISGVITHFEPIIFISKFITYIVIFSALISIFESFYKRPISFKNLNVIKKSLVGIITRFLKIFIPAFLVITIIAVVLIELNPGTLKEEKTLMHLTFIAFMLLLLIFSIYSIIHLEFRRNQLETYEHQLWIINNIKSEQKHEHYDKVNRILSATYKLMLRKWQFARKKSIWILIPHYDAKNNRKYFKTEHYKSEEEDRRTYDKMLRNEIPFLNTKEWLALCDDFYEKTKELKGEKLKEELLSYKKERNKISSVAGYVYLRNIRDPEIAKHFEENCIVYNDHFKSLLTEKEDEERTTWKSMVTWYISYNSKKIGVCFFYDIEKYGFRPYWDSLIMKIMANSIASLLYKGIEDGHYGESAKSMIELARDINEKDEIKEVLIDRHGTKEWKKQIIEISSIQRKFKGKVHGY